MFLSIIILNYKHKNLTRECIAGIKHANLGFEYEIIVVDNGSNDGVAAMLEKHFPDVRLILSPKNIGMGAGNNVGIRVAQGTYIMILNPDGAIREHSLTPLIHFLETHHKAGIVAPRILNPDRTHQVSVHRFPTFMMPFFRRTLLGNTSYGKAYLKNYVVEDIPQDVPSKVDWVFGPAFIIRRSLAEQLGGYDERFFLFLEDTDLCRRVWQSGYEVWYVPEAEVTHYPHRLSAHHLGIWSLRKKTTWYHIASWLKYFWKWRRTHKNNKA